jgi:glycosyltransferase involved in cell wall biosynthesis
LFYYKLKEFKFKYTILKNILNIVEDASLEAGGQRTATVNLHNFINESDHLNSTIITNKKEKSDSFIEIRPSNIGLWQYSPELKKYLNSTISKIDLLHIHGAWMYTQSISSKIAIKNKIPYIMTLHGMTTPYYLNQKHYKKKIYIDLFLNNMLKKSNVIHAITRFEKESIFKQTNHKNII